MQKSKSMKNMRILKKLLGILIFGQLFLSASLASYIPEGYFVSHEDMIRDYQITQEYSKRDFLSYILEQNPAVTAAEATLITERVIEVADQFGVDAKLFLALIRMESNFMREAVSPTGAVGLTQFTSIGAQEVSDQLGQRGPSYASLQNTLYLNNILLDGMPEWSHLWLRERSWAQQKLLFLDDLDLSLVYGAILLKVYLAKNYQDDLMANYYEALVDYNGEPGERKYWYARTILKFYDEI
ncbi:transglycosylase SLT domain-containing protein [Halobacteriovorax sp. ZH5_bin.2]|uniref:transglycosylase SLT domain-containing protein n=1 Tax=unclassified Halobacteriovorax TaxID=2639665 RepID=UPI003713C20A